MVTADAWMLSLALGRRPGHRLEQGAEAGGGLGSMPASAADFPHDLGQLALPSVFQPWPLIANA